MKRHVLALDLHNDPILIAEYEQYHRDVWPEIKASILESVFYFCCTDITGLSTNLPCPWC